MATKTTNLTYLTVQDILWINLQLTGKVHHYNFAKLEEATFYQYAYGTSTHVLCQAARFFSGFLKMKPLGAGNEATAFVGLVSFLRANGYEFLPTDRDALASLGEDFSLDAIGEALAKSTEKAHHGHEISVRQVVQDVLGAYKSTSSKLLAS